MTPAQKIKHLILIRNQDFGVAEPLPDINEATIDAVFEERGADWMLQDATEEVREGEVETGIKCDWSRHYESKAVGAKYIDGSWVGWTYWYGGGKHSDPEAIEWIPEVYDLACTEEEKVVTVRTFEMAPASQP